MFKKLFQFMTNSSEEASSSQENLVEEFKSELFTFQTKVFFEFTDITSDLYHARFEEKLYANFKTRPNALEYTKNTLEFIFQEKEFLNEAVHKVPNPVKNRIHACLEKQFHNIVSAKFSTSSRRATFRMDTYAMICVEFEQEEYKAKQPYSIDRSTMRNMLNTLIEIENKLKQMHDPSEFVLMFIDTLKTLNLATDKLTATKNTSQILNMLTNIQQTAESMVNESIRTEQELASLEINQQTNADLMLQLELDYTQSLVEKNKQLELLKTQKS